jgi:hypothetical protein
VRAKVLPLIAAVLLLAAGAGLSQDKPKIPISASSKTLGYSPLWVASKLGFLTNKDSTFNSCSSTAPINRRWH